MNKLYSILVAFTAMFIKAVDGGRYHRWTPEELNKMKADTKARAEKRKESYKQWRASQEKVQLMVPKSMRKDVYQPSGAPLSTEPQGTVPAATVSSRTSSVHGVGSTSSFPPSNRPSSMSSNVWGTEPSGTFAGTPDWWNDVYDGNPNPQAALSEDVSRSKRRLSPSANSGRAPVQSPSNAQVPTGFPSSQTLGASKYGRSSSFPRDVNDPYYSSCQALLPHPNYHDSPRSQTPVVSAPFPPEIHYISSSSNEDSDLYRKRPKLSGRPNPSRRG